MDYTALLSLIENDSELVAKMESGDHVGVAEALNSKNISTTKKYQLTTIDVMDLFGPSRGTEIMTVLRSLPEFSELIKLMDDRNAGVNINHRDADSVFESLVQGEIITDEERDQIILLRDVMISKAEQTLGKLVHHLDVAQAWVLKE